MNAGQNNSGPINDNSPLDEILDNLPQEAPPTDLQQRCMSAVRAAETQRAPATRPRWSAWRTFATAGASLVLVLVLAGALMPVMFRAREKARNTPPPMGMPGMAPMGGAGPSAPGMPGMAPGMGPVAHGPSTPEAAKARGMGAPPPMRPPTSAPGGAGMPGTTGARNALEKHIATDETVQSKQQPAAEDRSWGPAGPPAKPWRDESGERQKITQKRMELEVKKVEEAHDSAISIINKSEGHTTTEDLQVTETGKNRSHIIAQIPMDRLDGAVAQLRQLGKVKLLTGESEDVTKEYYGRGEDIREAGAGEDELVAKYEAEKDPTAKRRWYERIQALRTANKQGKRTLGDLSEKTHYALLDLTLIEEASPGAFFSRMLQNSTHVGGWLLATAIIWLPIVVIAWLVWRRRRP